MTQYVKLPDLTIDMPKLDQLMPTHEMITKSLYGDMNAHYGDPMGHWGALYSSVMPSANFQPFPSSGMGDEMQMPSITDLLADAGF